MRASLVTVALVFGTAGPALAGCAAAKLWVEAPDKTLRSESDLPPGTGGEHVLLLGVDGLRRDVFLDELNAGRLPGFSKLLGGFDDGEHPHAYVHPRAIAPFPSVTAAGWTAIVTGRPASQNGVTGNEMLLRPSAKFVAPVPMSVADTGDLLATFHDQLFADFVTVPTLYQRLHEHGLTSWVATNHVHHGADRLLLPGRGDLVQGLAQTLMSHVGAVADESAYSQLDDGTFDTVIAELEQDGAKPPNVLMVYASGTDLFAHDSEDGPVENVQRAYLRDQLDDRMAELADALERHGTWYVVLIADHGHTEMVTDDGHALGAGGPDAPAVRALTDAGFVVHEPALGVVKGRANAVFALQSGAAFLYLSDRSRCGPEQCYWGRPPRYRQDVLAAADALLTATHDGGALAGRVSTVLVRRPKPFDEDDEPFVVYAGDGATRPVPDYLRAHPEVGGPELARRLHHLAVGPRGERAGDVILIAHAGSTPQDRYYFSVKPYHSSHGAAQEEDSVIPFIVAHPHRSTSWLEQVVMIHVGETAFAHEVSSLVEAAARGEVPGGS